MKFIGTFLLLFLIIGSSMNMAHAQNAGGKDHGAAVAGTYDGSAYVELMQQDLKLKLELKRIHKDSVIVIVTNFTLPTGQKFNYRSKGVSVKPEVKDGKTIYRLHTSFMYDYNGMPMKVVATGTIANGQLTSDVKATIMDSMETKVSYKAKKVQK